MTGQGEMLNSVHATPYWMAPEVINESGYGRKSDTWSVDCTLFEMATGKLPLASMDRIAAITAVDFVHACLTRYSFTLYNGIKPPSQILFLYAYAHHLLSL
uniref:Protein kinase domain-containing protein n=1 Tax=Aquila chrysaetos chrysaetos TaxID=223781 RepID=A0A663DPG9_AQUCH